MENIIPPEIKNNISVSKQEDIKTPSGKYEIITVIILAVIFLVVLAGAVWDLYGKKFLTGYLCVSQGTTLNDLSATSTQQAYTPAINNQLSSSTKQNDSQIKTDSAKRPAQKTSSNIVYSSYGTCLENTKDGPAAKDCCDCLNADESVRKACRDATVSYDFSKNTTFKQFSIPSKLGRSGDYSAFTASGNREQCKQACEAASSGLMCGDYQYCRTACNNLPQ